MNIAMSRDAAAGNMPIKKVPANGRNSKNVRRKLSGTGVKTSCCSLDHRHCCAVSKWDVLKSNTAT
ncbi:hypothetical protein ABTJ98_21890, partial [Acinetobacter baumannii]